MNLIAQHSPQDAYLRVELDARVGGSDPRQLVTLCYEQLIGALGTALHAAARGDNRVKSAAMTKALSAVTALHLGISGEGDVVWALRHLYEATRRALLDSVLTFDAVAIGTIRADFIDILRAMSGAAPG